MLNITLLSKDIACQRMQGYCGNANTADQNDGQKGLGILNGNINDLDIQEECLRRCRGVEGVTGCEIYPGYNCLAHTSEVTKGSGAANHFCWPFSKCGEGKHYPMKYFT